MNLKDKTTDELAQIMADIQNQQLAVGEHLRSCGESLQRLKLKRLEVDKELTETSWLFKLKNREAKDLSIRFKMAENAFWSSKGR